MTLNYNYTKRMNTEQFNKLCEIAFSQTLAQIKNKHRNEI